MPENNPIRDSPEAQERRPLITVILGAIVVAAICTSAWFLFHVPSPNGNSLGEATIKIKMSPSEAEYFRNLQVKDISLSRAENFLHQEVTIVSGTLVNAGPETVVALDLTIEFSDQMGQVALRETRGVLGTPALPLAPGKERTFDISAYISSCASIILANKITL